MTKVLLVVTNHSQLGNTGKKTGYYLPELAHPYEVFKKANYQIDFVSPKGGHAPVDEGSVKAFEKDQLCVDFINNKEIMKRLDETLKPSDVNPDDYQAVFIVGGHGPLWDVTYDEGIAKIVSQIYERKGTAVAAVCHGPCGLLNVKLSNGDYLLKGTTVTSFSDEEERAVQLESVVPFVLEDELKNRGATYERAANWQACVRVSGAHSKLITGQNPASAEGTAKAVVEALQS